MRVSFLMEDTDEWGVQSLRQQLGHKFLSEQEEKELGWDLQPGLMKASLSVTERKTAKQYRRTKRWKRAVAALVESNLRYAYAQAKRFRGPAVQLMDLYQEAVFGLCVAATRFDVTKKSRFKSYATWWIKRFLVDYKNAEISLIRIPHNTPSDLYYVLEWMKYHPAECFKFLEHFKYACQSLGHGEQKTANLYDAYLAQYCWLGRNGVKMREIGEQNIPNFLGSDPAEALFLEEIRSLVQKWLDQRQRMGESRNLRIVEGRLGLSGSKGRTYKELAVEFGMSVEGIRQILKRTLLDLREFMERRGYGLTQVATTEV